MEEETKLNQTIVRSLAVCFCILVVTIGGCNAWNTKQYVDGGYTQGNVPATQPHDWIKK